MKEYSTFPKAQTFVEPHHQTVLCHILDTVWGSYPSAKRRTMYSAAPVDSADIKEREIIIMSQFLKWG